MDEDLDRPITKAELVKALDNCVCTSEREQHLLALLRDFVEHYFGQYPFPKRKQNENS